MFMNQHCSMHTSVAIPLGVFRCKTCVFVFFFEKEKIPSLNYGG